MDLNYYNLCFTLRLFGEPKELRYFANIASNGIDISGVLVLRYDGFIVSSTATKDSDSSNFVQIQGEGGYIVSQSTSSNLRKGFSVVTKSGEERFNSQDTENVLYYEMNDFIEAFKAGNPAVSHTALEESLTAAIWMDKARKDAGIVFKADSP
jgi:predicted dehydrogenase